MTFGTGQWIKSRNPEIPCVIHHRHNPSETTITIGQVLDASVINTKYNDGNGQNEHDFQKSKYATLSTLIQNLEIHPQEDFRVCRKFHVSVVIRHW
jgi:hypothetical protein